MINSLTARIFAIFWFTLALVLMLVLMVPKLDSRQITGLLSSEQRQGQMLTQHIEGELIKTRTAVSVLLWKRLKDAIEKWSPPGHKLILVTNEGRIVGIQRNEISVLRIVRNFIGQSDNSHSPKKKKYGRIEILGPFTLVDGEDRYQLYILKPATSPQSDFINLLFDRPWLLMLFTMLISSPLLLWLAWSLAKPARKLKSAADEVAKGNLKEHPDLESGPKEFRAAGVSFNHMINALNQMVSAQQRLISDISHELRTPLTRLQLGAALLRRRYGEGRELERIEMEAQRLESMINDLLALSRSQHNSALTREYVKVNQLWTDVLENARFEVEQVGKELKIGAIPGNGYLYCNRSALNSALENIIRNAVRYAEHVIKITFVNEGKSLTVYVDDDGCGVSDEDLVQIFRPFYRTDEARDRSSGGTGLGLAIVDEAITQHHGRVKAEASPLGGLRLIVWLPLQQLSAI